MKHNLQARASTPIRLGRKLVLIGIVFGFLIPFVPLLLSAFSSAWFYPALLPAEFSLRSWAYLVSPSSRLLEGLLTSLALSSLVAVFATLIALPAGLALGVYRFRGREWVQLLLIAPALVPGLTAVMGIHVLFIRYGLSDTFWGVVIAQLIPVTPYTVSLLAGVFENVEPTIEEQARTLGATSARAFYLVTLPSILPGLMVSTLFAFLVSWNEYILCFLIGGGQVMTMPILLLSLVQGGDTSLVAATALVFVTPAMLLVVVASRFLQVSSQGFKA